VGGVDQTNSFTVTGAATKPNSKTVDQESIVQMLQMGFNLKLITQAMRISDGAMGSAVEYCLAVTAPDTQSGRRNQGEASGTNHCQTARTRSSTRASMSAQGPQLTKTHNPDAAPKHP